MSDPRELWAMSMPLLGQFDPEFTQIMNEVMDLTRFAFRTRELFSGPGRDASSWCPTVVVTASAPVSMLP